MIFLFLYSYALVIQVNCFYDNTVSEYYAVEVLNKRISTGKHTYYYLELSPWGPKQEVDEVSMGQELYNRTEVGDEVFVYFYKGKLGIPWFVVWDE